MNYWINTISRNHVERGVAGGFTQAGHGKPAGLKRLRAGDWMVFYSPKTDYEGGEPLQAFTAIGQVSDEELYQVDLATGKPHISPGILRSDAHRTKRTPALRYSHSDQTAQPSGAQYMTPGFMPWRRNVDFKPCAETPIKPLIGDLSFIKDKTHWGYMFRFGLFPIPKPDFELIRRALST